MGWAMAHGCARAGASIPRGYRQLARRPHPAGGLRSRARGGDTLLCLHGGSAIAEARWYEYWAPRGRRVMAHKPSAVQLVLGAKHRIPVPINTARLELRPFRESDIDGIAQLLADYEATRFIGGVKSRD